MKKAALIAAAALFALPWAAQAQSPGAYIGAEGGLNWLFNFTTFQSNPNFGQSVNVAPSTGWAVGGMVGYDFVGPRVELETVYRYNSTNANLTGTAMSNQVGQLGVLANLLYDFVPSAVITPYAGAGLGISFVDSNSSLGSTVLAYQAIVGLGWNAASTVRVNLDARYFGTSNPTVNGSSWSNNDFSLMLGVQLKFPPPK